MADFDPDAFLKSTTAPAAPTATATPPAFDPDAFLKNPQPQGFDPNSFLKDTNYNPVEHAASAWGDKNAQDSAFQVYKQQQQAPFTAKDAVAATGQFLKGAIPSKDANGNWQWPLAQGAYQFGKGIVQTGKNIYDAQAGGIPLPGPNFAQAAVNAWNEDPKAVKAGRQLGVGVQEGALDAARMAAHAGQNISAATNAVTGGAIGSQAKDLSEADLRKRFNDEVEAHYLQSQMQQGRYAGEAEGGTSSVMTPEQLAAKGAPINPEEIGGIAATTNPTNLAEVGMLTNPLMKTVMAPLVKGAATAVETGGKVASAVAPIAGAVHGFAHGNVWEGLGEGAAGKYAQKVITPAANATADFLRDNAAQMAGEAPRVGQSAARQIANAGFQGAVGAVPTAAAFATTGENAEDAGKQFFGALGMGGILSGAGAVPGAEKFGAIDRAAAAGQLSKEGAASNFGVGYDAAHQQAMQGLSPQAQALINKYRGFWARERTANGEPVQVYAVKGDAFNDLQKQTGQVDAQGNPTNPNGRGLYIPSKGQFFVNVDSPGDVNAPLGHESGHMADTLGQFSDALLHQSLQSNIAQHLYTQDAQGNAVPTPEFQTFIDNYSKAVGAKAGSMTPQDFQAEYVAETARKILSGGNIEDFSMPKPISEKIKDGVSDFMANLGIKPAEGKLGFGGKEISAITKNVSDLLRQPTQDEAAPTSAQYRIDQLKTVLANPPGKGATVEQLDQFAAAKKEYADLLKKQDFNIPTDFPAAGKAPVAPGAPSVPASSEAARARISAASTLTAKNGMNLAESDARELINQANIQHGSPITDPANLVKAALKIKGGGAVQPGEFAAPSSAVSSSVGTGFNDHEGNRHTITGAATTPPKDGDFILNSDGNIRRVVKAWPDGKLDVVFAATNDTSSTQPVKPGTYTVLNTDVQPSTTTPGQPVSAGAVSGAPGSPTATETAPQTGQQVATANKLTAVKNGDHWIIQDAAGNPINSRTYKSEASANAGIRLQGRTIQLAPGPGGAPDILNHIAEMGGIAPKKATQEYDDMPALHKGYSAILGGTETPEDIARSLHEDHNIGDGSVATMWKLVQEAMDTRRTTTTKATPTDSAQETQQRAQAEQHVATIVQTAEQRAREALQGAAIRPEGLKLTTKEGKEWKKQQGDKEILTAADAEDRVRRAKIDAILADIGDDQTGLHKETDAFGNEKIVGDYDPTDPRHKALADIGGLNRRNSEMIQKVQAGKGKVTYIRYRGALSGAENAVEPTRENIETGMENRKTEYDQSPASTRTDEDATVHHKAIIPLDNTLSTPSGKIQPRAIVLDNLLHNIASIFEGLPLVGKENPYGATKEQQASLVTRDAQVYAQNHAHGYKGDGSAPMATFPDSGLPPVDPNYTPETIPPDRFAILNMAFGDERAGKFAEQSQKLATASAAVAAETNPTKKAAKQRTLNRLSKTVSDANEIYSLGAENNDWVDHGSGETNQLRAEIKAAGFDTKDRLSPVVQNLSPQHILETSDAPIPVKEGDIPSVRPSGLPIDPAELAAKGLPQSKGIGAGFLPSEINQETKELYRAADSPEARAGAHFSENEQDARAYRDNPGFGGKNVYKFNVDNSRVADVPKLKDLAEKLEPRLDEDQKNWAAENGGLERAIKDYGFDHVFHALENSFGPKGNKIDPVELLAKDNDWIRFNDDFPEGAKTWRYIGPKSLTPSFLPTESTPEGEPKEPGATGQPSGEQPTLPSSGAYQEDTGKPEYGKTGAERLTREAEAVGVSMSIETMKGILRGDKATMDKVRARIQEKTGQPARFLPATPYNPESDKTPIIEESDAPWIQRFSALSQKEDQGKLTSAEDDELDGLHRRINSTFGSLSAFDKARAAQGIPDQHEPLRAAMRKTTQQMAKDRLALRAK